MPVGERECGNKDRRKRKEMERGSLVQPSITFLGFKFVWLHFSLKHTEQERERSQGRGGEMEEDIGSKQQEEGNKNKTTNCMM